MGNFSYADRNSYHENSNRINYYAGPIKISLQTGKETITFETKNLRGSSLLLEAVEQFHQIVINEGSNKNILLSVVSKTDTK